MKLKKLRKISRRNALLLIAGFTGTAIFPSISFAQSNQALNRINEITKGLGVTESDIYLDLPEIAENGNQVKVSFEMDSPMTESDHIKTVYIGRRKPFTKCCEILFHTRNGIMFCSNKNAIIKNTKCLFIS